jgi:hypothetical protein
MGTYYKKGSANAICDVCGLKYKLDYLQKRWDGLWVCPDDFELRHPQDFIRTKPDINKLYVTKPRGPDAFIGVCTVPGRTCYAGYAMAGCAIAGNVFPNINYLRATDPTLPGYTP